MPAFAYRALTADGRDVRGVVDADSLRAARARLRRDGVFPTEVREEASASSIAQRLGGFTASRISGGDLAVVTRQLGTLIGAGLPIVEALGAVGEQSEKPVIRRTLSQIRERVTEGGSFAEALQEHPSVFTPLYVGMVRAGEAAGALDLVLDRLATYTEAQTRLASRVRSALAYPIAMVIISSGILFFLLGFVVPKVTRIFEDQRQALPLPTRILLAISHTFSEQWWLIALLLAAALTAAIVAWRRPQVRLWIDHRVLTLPLVGGIATRIAVARFSRTLATLLGGGVPLLGALEVAGSVAGNRAIEGAVGEARLAIREGQSIAEPLRRSGVFPSLLIHMVSVGEKSGDLEPMLGKVADAYEQEVETTLSTLTSLLEPVAVVVMGGIVVFIVLAILLPIFEINTMVK